MNGKKIDFAPLSKDDVIKIGDAVITVEEIDDEPEGISLDDDDEQDLLPGDDNVHDAPTERNLTPPQPGIHTQDTEMGVDLLPEKPVKLEKPVKPEKK